ncbi:2428_t:CDS:1, partial [Entrophospora sp. SA101]
GNDGIKMDPAKIEKVQNFPKPINVTQVRSFLRLCNYYRKFVKGFTKRSSPLTELLKKGEEFNWMNRQQRAFEDLIEQLTTEHILVYPNWKQPFILSTDASTFALGAILSQLDNKGNERVIAYASRQLRPADKNYAETELKCLGIIWAIKHFHTYLSGSKFKLITDHVALKYLINMKEPKGKLAHWIMTLQSYNFEVEHSSGKKHQNVNAMSRIEHFN